MTGTERLHGPPLRAAHLLHQCMKAETQLNCSIGIGTSRLIAKVCSDQAKPNGVLWIAPGREASFLAPLDVRKIPGVGKVMEKRLEEQGSRKVGDLAGRDELWLKQQLRRARIGAGGQVARSGCRRLVRHRNRRRRRPEVHQPRAHVLATTPTTSRHSSRCWRACRRWCAGACASTNCRPAPCSSSCATQDFHTITRARTVAAADQRGFRGVCGGSRTVSRELEGRARSSAWDPCLAIRGGDRANEPGRSDSPPEVE